MGKPVKPCSQYPKHKWEFVHNAKVGHFSKTSASLSSRGFYQCKCGATKYSSPK